MLPKPSLCLNIPKTGTSFMRQFFNAADWLEVRRLCGLNHCVLPLRPSLVAVEMLKRHGPAFGNLTCRAWDHHAGWSALPKSLRHLPGLCAMRDVESWYGSAFLYYTHAMKDTFLSRAIRLLVHGEECVGDPARRALLMRHRSAFMAKFEREEVSADSLHNLSVEFFLWFQRTIRVEALMRTWVGVEPPDHAVGFLTFRTITLLFDDPAKVLRMHADDFHGYFASGRYRQDVRCTFFLDFARLTDQLCAVMIEALGYTPEIVRFLRENLSRKNVSIEEQRPRVRADLARSPLFAQIREEEQMYERYLLPLAVGPSPAAGAWGGQACSMPASSGRQPGSTVSAPARK